MSETAASARERWMPLLAALLIVTGAALRVAACGTELWLDELHSLVTVSKFRSPLQLLTDFQSDNNHLLNSLWLWTAGKAGSSFLYRLPALVSGVLTLPLIWLIAKRRNGLSGALATGLFSFSYLFVLYSSEARGYGVMIFLLAAATALLSDAIAISGTQKLLLFALAVILGSLAHFSFALFLFGALPYAWRRYGPRECARLFALPSAFLAALFFFYIRHLPEGTGTLRSYWDVSFSTLSLLFGGPVMTPANVDQTIACFQIAAATFCILAIALLWSWRTRDEYRELFAGTIVVAPLTVFFILQPRVLFPRYFLVPLFFALLLTAYSLAELLHRRRGALLLVIPLLAVYIAGQSRHLYRLLTSGRGGFQQAAALLAERTPGETVYAGANQPYRVGLPLEYFLQQLNPAKHLEIQSDAEVSTNTSWYLVQDDDRAAVHPDNFTVGMNRFVLLGHFPSAEESGLELWLYRRAAP